MKPADWKRLKDLFEQALRVEPAGRDSFLRAQTADRDDLAELRSLLDVYERSPEFLEGAAPEIGEIEAFDGRRMGPWRLIREIGRGGMGVVWEAQRVDEEYEQRVAIKVLPAGLLSSSEIARFREERQILARLTHPGITRLLDGGTAADGSPYLVMEYVEGEPLDEWARQRAPSLRERLKMFLSVSAAVDYAHRHLIIHRDLKPANILVTPEGTAKLLDFGIAKLLDPDGATRRAPTGTARHLTPEYASPEQIRGEMASTASDIYSLGVVLYRLLTGRPPYAADAKDSLQTMQAICEEDPPLPSAVAETGARELRGELDAIVLQALHKNPEKRYPSVRAMADDIAAWLEGRPVSAHRRPFWRRSLQHIRRHKTQSAAVAGVLASILVGAGVSLWYARDAARQRQIAEVRFDDGRRLAHSVVFELQEAIARLPGSTRAREILVERALGYLRALEASGPASRDLQVELAAAYSRIGDVQGNPYQAHLGNTKAALESETQARRLALTVLGAHAGDAEADEILADADERLALLGDVQGDSGRWIGLWQEGIRIRRRQAALHPADTRLAATVRSMEAYELRLERRWNDALAAYEQVADLLRGSLTRTPSDLELGDRLSTTYHQIARCRKELGQLNEALAAYREAQRLDASRLTFAAGDTGARTDLSFDLLEAGWIEYRLGRFKQAIADYEQALALQEQLSAADPQDIRMRLEAAKLLNTAAPAYEAAGDRGKAIEVLHAAGARLEAALASDPDNQDTRLHVGWVWCNLGEVYQRAAQGRSGGRQANWVKAGQCYQRAVDTLRALKGEGRPDLDIDPRRMVARSEAGLVVCRKHLGERSGQ
jgi:tetratricopeptide (TPR) repeat protein